MIVADLNGDGRPDLAVANGNGLTISVLQNVGNTFAPAVGFGVGGPSSGIVAGDFNGDGKPDLVITGGGLWLLINNTPAPAL
jgi:hypothetical protein